MKINAEWHKAYRMPKNPTLAQRTDWHIAHAENCSCRPPPQEILEEIKKRGRDS